MGLSLAAWRKLKNQIALTLALLAVLFGLFWLFWILETVFDLGLNAMKLAIFTQMTPPPGTEGGLLNAIVGSLILVGLGTALGTPIGILAGVYLAEYGRYNLLGQVTLFINDILLSAPSIIVGLFIYEVHVARVGHFSGIAGVLALAMIVIPVVIRATQNMLLLVPPEQREAAFALGAPRWKVIVKVTLKASMAGILTGILLAIARISGETAPLLFTALSNQFWSLDLNQPLASLPVTIFKFAMSPYKDWQDLAWAAVVLITLGVLALNIAARVILARTQNK